MDNRLELQTELEKLLGSRNVYYQPPSNFKMEYPCIRYNKDIIDVRHADNTKYLMRDRYTIIVIDKKPDNKVIKELLKLPFSTFERHYVSDNLNHDVIRIYY